VGHFKVSDSLITFSSTVSSAHLELVYLAWSSPAGMLRNIGCFRYNLHVKVDG